MLLQQKLLANSEKLNEEKVIEPPYTGLNRNNHITVFEFGDERGTGFFRVHNPQKFDDFQITIAVNNVNDLSIKNKESIQGLSRELKKFSV